MKAVIQRVTSASVEVEGKAVASIGTGLLLFLGVEQGDTEQELEYLIKKVPALRIFNDSNGKMNLSVRDIEGEVLVVSQFTLLADTRKGNRPSFVRAEAPERAKEMYLLFVERLRSTGVKVQAGEFAAHMKVSLVNDGPVTIVI